MTGTTRRQFLQTVPAAAAARVRRPAGTLIDTHIHLFAPDHGFPYHKNATYTAPPFRVEQHLPFVKEARLDHTVIVHPEPYQDDHRYLEYCFAHEPTAGYFKGTCLFDPLLPDTPGRMAALAARHPGRIVALRIHQMAKLGTPPARGGAIKDRDMRDPAMKRTWSKARELGFAIQMHFLPFYAPQIGELAAQFPGLNVILDHLGRAGQGTPEQFEGILKLARLPQTYMKFSGWRYSSQQGHPFRDAQIIVRRIYDAFGPDRIIWGGLGRNMQEFKEAVEVFDVMFGFASEADRVKIRGRNAVRLFKF